jgi:hypothetical protein
MPSARHGIWLKGGCKERKKLGHQRDSRSSDFNELRFSGESPLPHHQKTGFEESELLLFENNSTRTVEPLEESENGCDFRREEE